MVSTPPTVAAVWGWLEEVADPEIPALSVVDLGIVRDVAWRTHHDGVTLAVTLTPTYSGCPATRTIERAVEAALRARGIERIELKVRLSPPWTTDWLSHAAREKLRAYGIAPPAGTRTQSIDLAAFAKTPLVAERAACPQCRSLDTMQTSRFGSTPCKASYRCNACREPFDYFKCH